MPRASFAVTFWSRADGGWRGSRSVYLGERAGGEGGASAHSAPSPGSFLAGLSQRARRMSRFGFCVPVFANPGAAFFRTPAWTQLEPETAISAAVGGGPAGHGPRWGAGAPAHRCAAPL